MVETPVQTNAADPEQVKEATDAQTWREQVATADARAELADYDARRRAFTALAPLFEDIRNGDMEGVFRMLGRREVALDKWASWVRHPELCTQMLAEGIKRLADEQKTRRARHMRTSR